MSARRAAAAAWPFVLLLMATALVRGLFALEPPGSDQGLFIAQADLLTHGARLYADVWEHKPPGVVAMYLLALELFGRSYAAIKLMHAFVAWLSASLLLAVLLRAGLSRAVALCAALGYVAFCAGPVFGGFWAVAQAETFLDPLLLAALLLIEPWAVPRTSRCLGAGVAIGVAIAAVKYSALPWLALAGLCSTKSQRLAGVVAFLSGCALAGLGLCAYFALTGRWTAWFDATVLFNLDHQRVGAAAFWDDPLERLFPAVSVFLPFYAFALVAVLAHSDDKLSRWLTIGLSLWVLAFLQVLMQHKFWAYHYHVLLVPLCVVASVGLQRASAVLSRRVHTRLATSACIVVACLLSFGYATRCVAYVQRHALWSALRAPTPPDDFLLSYNWGANEYSYAVDNMVAQQIAVSTAPDDRILIWAFEPLIYFLAERQPATRFLYDYPLTLDAPSRQRRYLALLLHDMRKQPPALIVTRTHDQNNIEQRASFSQLRAMPELASYLDLHYVASWRLADFVGFERKPQSPNSRP